MGTLVDKLSYLNETKNMIRNALVNNGVEVSDQDAFRSYADKISNMSAGIGTGKYVCRVIDYNGSILKEQHLNTGEVFKMPTTPIHDDLIFQEWATPVEINNNEVVVGESDLIFGATYTTLSGNSEFDICLTKVTGLTVTLNMNGTKDWGDGVTNTENTHTYANYGEYTIICDGNTMTDAGIFGQSFATNYYCLRARFGRKITSLENYAFHGCYSMEEVVMPNTITNIGNYCFNSCCALKSIVIPNSITSISDASLAYCTGATDIVLSKNLVNIGATALQKCYSITNITIPNNVKSIGNEAFGYCYALRGIRMPNGLQSMGDAFVSCYSLEAINIPPAISTIGKTTFQSCFLLRRYDFSMHTTIPTIPRGEPFANISALAKIIVPDNLYAEWRSSTYWSAYSDYIYKASEVTE